jgi:hypothetical protein
VRVGDALSGRNSSEALRQTVLIDGETFFLLHQLALQERRDGVAPPKVADAQKQHYE